MFLYLDSYVSNCNIILLKRDYLKRRRALTCDKMCLVIGLRTSCLAVISKVSHLIVACKWLTFNFLFLPQAVEFQQEGCVQLLTSYRADVETSDGQGNTSLHLAVSGGSLAIISLLVKAGASLNTRNKVRG